MKRETIGALTGLRFVTALFVLVFHMGQRWIPTLPDGVSDFFNAGFIGVNIFFVLSGFILVYNYVGDGGRLRVSRADFFAARVARIVPTYAFCMLLALPILFSDLRVAGLGSGGAMAATTGSLCISAVFMQAWIPFPAFYLNVPSWSLSSEMFFYLCFPAIILLLRKQSIGSLASIATAVWLVGMSLPVLSTLTYAAAGAPVSHVTDAVWIAVLKYNPLVRVSEFVIGVVTGSIFIRVGPWDEKRSAVVTLAMLACIAVLMSTSSHFPYLIIHNGLLTPFVAVFIYALAGCRNFVASFLASPAMVLLGEASYALYLFHLPFARYTHRLSTMLRIDPDTGPYIALAACVAVSCSLAIYRFVEKPGCLALRTRLKKALPAQAEPPRARIIVLHPAPIVETRKTAAL